METEKDGIKIKPKQPALPKFTFEFEIFDPLANGDKIETKTIEVEAGTINSAFEIAVKAVEGKQWKLI